MKKYRIQVVMAITVSVTLGCGSGMISEQRERPSSPASQIDPFEFGDEFLATPESTATDDLPTEPGDNTVGTDMQPPGRQTTPVHGSEQLMAPGERTFYRILLSGVFDSREEADRYADRARRRIDTEVTVEFRTPFYRVYTGRFSSQQDADMYVQLLRQEGFNEARRMTVTGATP